ncbi:hypothetical protein CcaverHIS002_0209630 [Cutaneotrichosporon cavernicola]|nr:hypothetical protein CcaverHIS002_0209630 [Cutaneotrichosporon cavernicola]
MSLDAGEIIYKAFVPTLKMALCIAAGFVLTKTGSLLPDSIRGISLITLNLSLPCLVFSSMVKSFTPATVQAFGPLLMIGIMYQVMGGLLALVMGIVSNWGNLPTAVVQTMAREAPFNPETDVDLGVAYIAIFILLMNSVFFALGVHRVSEIPGPATNFEMCGWDFAEDRRVSNETFKQRWSRRLSKFQRPHDASDTLIAASGGLDKTNPCNSAHGGGSRYSRVSFSLFERDSHSSNTRRT